MQKQFLNPETDSVGVYSERWLLEKVKVKDIDDLIVRNHYWEDEEGELWVDFDDPDENLRNAFTAYRSRIGFMSASEVAKLRKDTGLSVRKFASHLGISSSVLSQIENNKRIQTKYQDMLFKSTRDEYNHSGRLSDSGISDQNIMSALNIDTEQDYSHRPKTNYQVYSSNQLTVFTTPILGDAA